MALDWPPGEDYPSSDLVASGPHLRYQAL